MYQERCQIRHSTLLGSEEPAKRPVFWAREQLDGQIGGLSALSH